MSETYVPNFEFLDDEERELEHLDPATALPEAERLAAIEAFRAAAKSGRRPRGLSFWARSACYPRSTFSQRRLIHPPPPGTSPGVRDDGENPARVLSARQGGYAPRMHRHCPRGR